MTPEEAVAHKAQEQFDEYEREIAALRAALTEYEQALTRIAAPPTDRDGIGVTARAIATAVLAAQSGPDSVTHNPKPDWTVTHPRSTTCPWCSEPPDPEYHEHGPLSWEKRDDVEAWRCDVCGAFPVPIGVDEERHAFADGLALGFAAAPPAEGLDVERLVASFIAEATYHGSEVIGRIRALAPEQPE